MKTKILFTLLIIISQTSLFAQNIEKMGKNELREYIFTQIMKIDSLQLTLNNLKYLSNNTKISYDSIAKKYYDLRTEYGILQNNNSQLQKEIHELTSTNKYIKDSLENSKIQNKNQMKSNNLREYIIRSYLQNRSFGLLYFNSYDGIGPNGSSFTSIVRLNDKYYISDISNDQKETIKPADNNQTSEFQKWNFEVDNELKFRYSEGNNIFKYGSISTEEIIWKDFIQSDSTYMSSIILDEQQIKIPIGVIDLETIRGTYEFMVYYILGRKEYVFNEKKYYSINPLVLESNNVYVILDEKIKY